MNHLTRVATFTDTTPLALGGGFIAASLGEQDLGPCSLLKLIR